MTLRVYIMRRILLGIFVLWVAATLDFLIFAFIQGEPGAHIFGKWGVAPETEKMILYTYGYNDPWPIKYLKYLRNMFTYGFVPPYFGWSDLDKNFVAYGLTWRLPITLMLVIPALTGSIILGILLGVFAASKRTTKKDVGITASTLLTWGIPIFFIQLLLIFFFGRVLRDTYGIRIFTTTFDPPHSFFYDPRGFLIAEQYLLLPILTLMLAGLAPWVLRTRNLLVDQLEQDYVRTAQAKGISDRKILYKHAFRSILPSIATLIGLSIPVIITGSMLTELLFGINGIGSWYIKCFENKETGTIYFILDPAVAQAVFFIYATMMVIFNFIADLLCGVFDPRIRVGTQRQK
jgi:peptide/nickel transport system permease protein